MISVFTDLLVEANNMNTLNTEVYQYFLKGEKAGPLRGRTLKKKEVPWKEKTAKRKIIRCKDKLKTLIPKLVPGYITQFKSRNENTLQDIKCFPKGVAAGHNYQAMKSES